MKKIILTAAIFLTAFAAFSQEMNTAAKDEAPKQDTVKIKWKGSLIWIFDAQPTANNDTTKPLVIKPKKRDFVHWSGFDLGVCMLTTIDNKFRLPVDDKNAEMNNFLDLNYGKSMYFSLNAWENNFRIYKNYFILSTGLGMEWNSYNFNKNITLNPDAPFVSTNNSTFAPDSIKYFKNKLKVTYLKMPLLLTFNTNSESAKKSFHIAGGLELGYRIGTRTKQRYDMNDYEVKTVRRDNYGLADFKYGAIVRMGYGDNISLFLNYGLSELQQGNKGPEDMDLFPVSAGISIGL